MSGFVIQKNDIGDWLDSVAKSRSIFTPQYDAKSDLVKFAPREAGTSPDFEKLTTTASPKGFFFPQTETLMEFRPGEDGLELTATLPPDEKRMLFGIRTCDARALVMLDSVFGWDFKDPYYLQRRMNTALVAIECREPRLGCFCEALDPIEGPWDVLITDLGDVFYAEPATDTGMQLIEIGGDLLKPATGEQTTAREEARKSFRSQFPEKLDAKTIAEKGIELWNDPVFDELSRRCIGCGACSFLCPTCHCFDIQDDGNGTSGVRFRCWDTCQERDFTAMGHGHNPRPSRKERHRQRVLHKFVYYPARFGMAGCVGCGRCVVNCPVNIDVREVLRKLAG